MVLIPLFYLINRIELEKYNSFRKKSTCCFIV